MRFDVLTLFPPAFDSFRTTSIIGKAIDKGTIEVHTHDIRDFATNKHRKVDDVPYGGGVGMVMMPQPLFDGITHVKSLFDDNAPVIYMTPQGRRLRQPVVEELAGSPIRRIILLCGHYEGIDYRVREALVDDEISIGDFVLTGGELPAQVVMESIARFVPSVLGKDHSAEEESFSTALKGRLEYPHYTRPADFRGIKIPDILLTGHHANINAWRFDNTKPAGD